MRIHCHFYFQGEEEIPPSQDRLEMLRAVIKSAQAVKQKQPKNTKEFSETADNNEEIPEGQVEKQNNDVDELEENNQTIKKTNANAIPFDMAECTVNDLSPRIILERSKQIRSMLMNHTDTLNITGSGEQVLQNAKNNDDNNGSKQNDIEPNPESVER